MKTIKRNLLVVVLMLGTLVNYAKNSELNNVLSTKKVKVVFKGADKGQRLKVKDDEGVTLHFENVSRRGNLIKYFDFSGLESGNYTLELEKDNEIIIKSIIIEGKTVVFTGEKTEKIFKPVIRNINNKLMISQVTFDENPLGVEIYYKNEVIYSESVKGNNIINRIYKLDAVMTGNYKVIVHKNGRNYSKEFKF